MFFVNPEIIEKQDELQLENEGCLSIPGILENVKRTNKIEVTYFDQHFNSCNEILDGYLARVMNWQTDLGKILDPIADKVLLIGTVLILWMNSYIPIFVLAVFVLRDFIIIMGAAFHMTVYETPAPNPNIFGKI